MLHLQVNTKEVDKSLQAMALTIKEPWMLVLYNICAVHTTSDLEVMCTSNGASNTRVVSVCTVMGAEGTVVLRLVCLIL